MKYLPAIAGALLGLIFAFVSLAYFFHWMPERPAPPEGSAVAMFFGAFAPTGYLDFVKMLELIGAILVAVPFTRRLGLLILGPIIVNILAYTIFVAKGANLFSPMLIAIVVLGLFLLWAERRAFWVYIRGVKN